MAWFRKARQPLKSSDKRDLPSDVFDKCKGCGEVVYGERLAQNSQVCPECGFHFRISPDQYLDLLLDPGTFQEQDSELLSRDPLKFGDLKPYSARLKAAESKLGKREGVVVGEGSVDGIPVCIGVMDFRFLGGSMGSVVGEKVARIARRALELRRPLIMVSASGGARMQEGIYSLMQLAKTSAVLARVHEANLPYISILTDPTTGGTTASFAMLGDVHLAEPKALIGFAGPRVIEETIKQGLPKGFQRSEFLLDHGMVDKVVDRRELKSTVSLLLRHMWAGWEGRGVKVPPDSVFSGNEGDLQGGGDISLNRVFPPLPTGVHWGLERTETLLKELDSPQDRYPTLHVGGTNGKGSIAAVWAQILREDGKKVGLYTSPHLCSFRERFQIDGRPVSADTLLAAADGLRDAIARIGLTFFEAATVLAFHLFAESKVDIALVEVGLGGRLDSTNVIRPQVTAITNVALDHAEYLGFTLEEIAAEKAGIIKPGVPVVTAERDSALREIFRVRAESLGAPFIAINAAEEVLDLEVSSKGNTFRLKTDTWGVLDLRSPLPGRHQAANAALAIRSLELLGETLRPRAGALRRGVEGVRWPGRLQIHEGTGGLWVFDVAHNTAGVRALATSLRRLALPEPIVLLVGIQGDKDWRSMLPPLFAISREAVLTQPPSVPPERRWDPLEAAGAVRSRPNLHILPNFQEGLEMARSVAGGGTVVVTGSHHTVGDAMNALGILPYGPE